MPWLVGFYSLPDSVGIAACDAYKQGRLYGVDAASGAAVMALAPKPGEHVLDLCAAPGTSASTGYRVCWVSLASTVRGGSLQATPACVAPVLDPPTDQPKAFSCVPCALTPTGVGRGQAVHDGGHARGQRQRHWGGHRSSAARHLSHAAHQIPDTQLSALPLRRSHLRRGAAVSTVAAANARGSGMQRSRIRWRCCGGAC